MESAIRDEAFNHERAIYALPHATLEDVRFADAPSGRNPLRTVDETA